MAKKLSNPIDFSKQEEKDKAEFFLHHLSSAEELRNWFKVFFKIDFPAGTVYENSTHGPVEAAWKIYEIVKNKNQEAIPSIVILSSRDSYKTLLAAALEVLLMVHFRLPVSHLAAIMSQSDKAVTYVNAFFRKIKVYLEYCGWQQLSDNKRMVEWLTPDDENVYLSVIIATVAGCNSQHTPLLFIDEVDVVNDYRALEESTQIPCEYNGYFPLTVNLSTRKYAAGLMEKTINKTQESGGEILRWNILDVTKKIPDEEARIWEPKVKRYISKDLPMANISPEEYETLPEELKLNYEEFMAYAGIAEHKMLSVMKNYLVDRPATDVGELYKSVKVVHNKFKSTSDDMANAQLLCNKPSTSGLVYNRFDEYLNTITLDDAFEQVRGERIKGVPHQYLINYMHQMGVEFYAGADWGWTDETSLVVLAILPGGEVWIMDLFSSPGLEIDEIIVYARILQEKYNIIKWYCDNQKPAYIKRFKREFGRASGVEKYKDSVSDGITAVKSKIVNAAGKRYFKLVSIPSTKRMAEAFKNYKWKLDGSGDAIEGVPEHGKDGTSDIMDAMRYVFQALFGEKTKTSFAIAQTGARVEGGTNEERMRMKVKELVGQTSGTVLIGRRTKKSIIYNI